MMKLHTIFPFIRFFLAPLMGFFAAGADVFGAVEGGEVFVDDASDAGGEEADASGAAEGEGEAGKEGKVEPGKETQDQSAAPAGPQLAKPLSSEAAAALKGVRETNPKAFKEINSRLWALNGQDKKIQEAFPEGGLDAAIELKGNVDSFLTATGARDLQEIQSELHDFRSTDAKIAKGDPSFVNDLPENIKAGIFNMMPNFVQSWAETNKDSHDRYFAGLVVNTLRDTEFTMQLRDASRELERMGLEDADTKRVYDSVKACLDWIGKMQTQATAAPQKKEAQGQDDSLRAEKESIQKEKMGLAKQRVGTGFRRYIDPKMNGILKGIYQGKVPANVQKAEVFAKSLRSLVTTLGQSFIEKIDQYLAAGDEDGALKYMTSQATEARISAEVEKANKYLYGVSSLGGRKPAPNTNQNGNRQPNNNGAPGAAGVAKINFNPKPTSIDYAASDKWAKELGLPSRNRLFAQNKAVLKGGKKVEWTQDSADEQ